MKRVIILLLDSFGIGGSPDAKIYGDEGANTFGHIFKWRQASHRPLHIPNLTKKGLLEIAKASDPDLFPEFSAETFLPENYYGYASEVSRGKDTPSGHWEIAGVPVLFEWGYFKPDYPSFPEILINQFLARTNLSGILGNCHASGTEIIERLGDEHIKTGKPIIYTSGDSVFQIAAHEDFFGLDRLYAICEIARELVNPYNIGRVIARPFIGKSGNFLRTGNRRDYTMPPPGETLLEKFLASGVEVIGIGKTGDIFANRGLTKTIHPHGTQALFDATLDSLSKIKTPTLIFTNFTDFDTVYGHRRNVEGYASELETFDARLLELEKMLQPEDLVLITADHGCDPTWKGTDHTRENIPILLFGPNIRTKNIGHRHTFSDIGQSVAKYFGISPLQYGESFL